jgi:hypothetical protein
LYLLRLRKSFVFRVSKRLQLLASACYWDFYLLFYEKLSISVIFRRPLRIACNYLYLLFSVYNDTILQISHVVYIDRSKSWRERERERESEGERERESEGMRVRESEGERER